MAVEREQVLEFLARLGAQPAVAFHEYGVASTIKTILEELGLGYRADAYGNIIVRISGQDSAQIPIAFVAHMDHPGFEAIATHEDCLVGKALGGVPVASFSGGIPVQMVTAQSQRLPAATVGRWGNEADRQVLIRLNKPQPLDLPCPAVIDLVDFELDGEFIRMRALDDLAGCASILATLSTLSGQPAPGDVYGVFTRAEEVGLVGARLMAEAGTLPRETLVVSMESSRTLPGAAIGAGPVIRVGDAASTFNAEAETTLVRAQEKLQAGPEGFKVQRQLMSGGTCEATAFALYGYRTTGIAFPLGNYHNSGPDGRVEAEYIHVDDFMGGVTLMTMAVQSVPDRGDTAARRRLRQMPQEWLERLRTTAGKV
jgi:endoglucanase